MSLSEYVENCCSKIIDKLMNKVHLRVFALRYFAKDTMFLFCHYNAMGCRVFTGQKMFREKFIKVRDRNFILCQGIGIWKENQKLKHC